MRASDTDADLLLFAANGAVPNNPALPVLLIRGALAPDLGPEAILDRYRHNGWTGLWTWTVFDYHHFHPASHEALTVASGAADLILGGPGGRELHVTAGDMIVLPAGTGHCRVAATGNFSVCGAYPPGQENPQIVRAENNTPRPEDVDTIAATPHPKTDPLFGVDGPLTAHWRPV